ncbi:MAG: hypothetical protein GF331_20250, partial [Chitinivibrionales bacterium]|nr:hypothetical protein [Chitinivibrionales bacterium]
DVVARVWREIRPVLDEHGSRTPASTLGGLPYTEMVEEIEAMLKGIGEGAERIRRIVYNLKDFMRPDLGELNQNVDINAVVEASLLIVNNMIKKSTKAFTVDLARDLPRVRGNAQQLEQVVINLVTNACQSLPDAFRAIHVGTGIADDGQVVEVSVVDEGAGIPQDIVGRVMDPFFTTKRDSGGTGLGLSVSYNIVKAHGGALLFESKPGGGTAATVRLPRAGARRLC